MIENLEDVPDEQKLGEPCEVEGCEKLAALCECGCAHCAEHPHEEGGAAMTDEQVIDVLKGLWDRIDQAGRPMRSISATVQTGPDRWRTFTVRDPSILDEAPDGFAVVVEDGEL